MKTKLEMAHEYLRDIISNWEYNEHFDPVAEAWQYADAMQAEEDKREIKGVPEAILRLTKDKDGNCLHFHHEFGHKKCMDCGASLEGWQPDWSQAPEGATEWRMLYTDVFKWIIPIPFGEAVVDAPSFNYQGNWQDSLRKRP